MNYYLDHAATSPMRPQARAAMEPFHSDVFGNPSGAHEVSRRAKNALEDAREQIADLLGASPGEIVFTAGGTEADNLAVKGSVFSSGGKGAVITSPVEHEAVLESAEFVKGQGCILTLAVVDKAGRVNPEEIAGLVTADTAVVSIMSANNETGVCQPIGAVAAAVKKANPACLVHTDAVQGYVSQSASPAGLGVDLMTLSAHKFGGPKGVGLLYVKSGTHLEPVLHGGGQEMGRRSGTHNVMGAVGMAAAMQALENEREDFRKQMVAERDSFESVLAARSPEVVFTAAGVPRLVQTSHVQIPGVRNETLLARLDRRGVAASAASACQSGAATVSHVLEAMGMTPSQARQCLRFSFGWSTRSGEGAEAAQVVAEEVEALR